MSKEMSSSINEASFAELFEQVCKKTAWKDKVAVGVVVSVDDNFVTVDVGLKSEGRIGIEEFICGGKKMEIKIGDEIEVFIDRYENKGGDIVLSREKAIKAAAWDRLEDAFKNRDNVIGSICSSVKGGFMVDVNGVMAFLPGSQVDVRPTKDIGPLQNIEQPFKVLKVDRLRENIVVSRREVLVGTNADWRKTTANFEEGQIIEGTVKTMNNYGAFIDLGPMDGLLHNTDISWKRINHPSEVLAIGQLVKVMIIKVNKETGKVSLGMKQLMLDPWEGVEIEFPVDSAIKGKVTNVTDYGIFVELKEGVEGLIYVSEVSWKKNMHPSKVASSGDEIEVKVLDVDPAKRRIGLSLKHLQENPWDRIVARFSPGYVFEGVISNVVTWGLFVQIDEREDIDGMVHLSDISWERISEEGLAKYKKGDVVKVVVLEIDQNKGKIALGMKQLTENPYGNVATDTKKGTSDIKKGAIVTSIVSEVKDSGVQVTLANGSRGFIRKTDLAKDRQDRTAGRFAVGEKVDAKVISIDKNGNVELSIKALEIEEEKHVMAAYGSSDSGASLGDILGVAIGKKNDPAA